MDSINPELKTYFIGKTFILMFFIISIDSTKSVSDHSFIFLGVCVWVRQANMTRFDLA